MLSCTDFIKLKSTTPEAIHWYDQRWMATIAHEEAPTWDTCAPTCGSAKTVSFMADGKLCPFSYAFKGAKV